MPDSVRENENGPARTAERCAGVRGCAADLPAHGVRVCGCVYTAHHTPVLTTTEEAPRCADPESRTPSSDPEPVGAIAERVLTDLAHGRDPHLAARQREALNRLHRAHQTKEPKP